MNKIGWLVNDCLTCIPGTKTFWHNLLEWIPNLCDMTGGYTDYSVLADVIESKLEKNQVDYIIRNGTYFRKLSTNIKTISLIQDVIFNDSRQIDVCNNSSVIVFNSKYCESFYRNVSRPTKIIPLGIDFDFFKPLIDKEELKKRYGIKDNTIIYIGDSSSYPKGFDLVQYLINHSSYDFCLIMKDNYTSHHPRVKVFNRVPQSTVVELINCCDIGICTSKMETEHLGGIEIGACNLPIVATEVGIYYDLKNEERWGKISTPERFLSNIDWVLKNRSMFDTRNCFQEYGLSIESCKKTWIKMTEEI